MNVNPFSLKEGVESVSIYTDDADQELIITVRFTHKRPLVKRISAKGLVAAKDIFDAYSELNAMSAEALTFLNRFAHNPPSLMAMMEETAIQEAGKEKSPPPQQNDWWKWGKYAED